MSLAGDLANMTDLENAEAPVKPDENGRYKINKPGDNEGVIDWKPKRKK